MDESPQNKKSAGDEGQRAKLVCRAQGAPNITFTWSREGVTLSASDKYDITLTQIDLVVWESTLEVSALRSRDYGQYDCIARNEMGFNKTSVILTGTSRPDPPLTLHVVNASHDAVELSWKPGFDGGLPQAYRIRYRQVFILPSSGFSYFIFLLLLLIIILFLILSYILCIYQQLLFFISIFEPISLI